MHFSSTGRGFGPGMLVLSMVVIIAFVFIMNGEDPEVEIEIPNTLLPVSPAGSIATYMKTFEDNGYTVEKIRELEPVSKDEFNRLIIEYKVESADGSQTWDYSWAWVVPVQLITSPLAAEIPGNDNPTTLDGQKFNMLLSMAELIALTPEAEESMPALDQIIAEGQS